MMLRFLLSLALGSSTPGLAAATATAAAAERRPAYAPECAVEEELHTISLLQKELGTRRLKGGARDAIGALKGMLPAAAANLPTASLPEGQPDIPEAGRAWALWQVVREGPADPQLLRNESDAPLVNLGRPSSWQEAKALGTMAQAAVLNESAGFLYRRLSNEDPPVWKDPCLGKDYKFPNTAGSEVVGVVVPQVVPFVVPLDHVNRTDIAVVVVPGGGGSDLAWQSDGTDVAKTLNAVGISAFVVKYRVPEADWGVFGPVEDTLRAVRLVRHHAAALGLNASRVGVYGDSHGGHLALTAAFSAGGQYSRTDPADDWSPRPDFLLLLYPEVHIETFMKRAAIPQSMAWVDGLHLKDLSSIPPTFIAIGGNDTCTRPESVYAFYTLLKATSRSQPVVEINMYTDVGHGFGMCYRHAPGGYEAMLHEACLWMLRAQHFIMWNVLGTVPKQIDAVYRMERKFDPSLIARNKSK